MQGYHPVLEIFIDNFIPSIAYRAFFSIHRAFYGKILCGLPVPPQPSSVLPARLTSYILVVYAKGYRRKALPAGQRAELRPPGGKGRTAVDNRRDRQADRSAAAQDPGTEGPDAGKVLRTAGRKLRILGPDRAGRTAHQPAQAAAGLPGLPHPHRDAGGAGCGAAGHRTAAAGYFRPAGTVHAPPAGGRPQIHFRHCTGIIKAPGPKQVRCFLLVFVWGLRLIPPPAGPPRGWCPGGRRPGRGTFPCPPPWRCRRRP